MMQAHSNENHDTLELNGNLDIADMKETWLKTITEYITKN
jgi:hypothetical protein